MNKTLPIRRTRYGREIEIQPQVLLWRKRMRQYNALKASIMRLLLDSGLGPTEAAEWLKTPCSAFNGQTPRSLLNPVNIVRLHAHVKRQFRTK